jgi:hypothetical protein
MELTKDQIDSLSHYSLLCKWRFAKAGDLMFQGESGDYFEKRLA